MRFRSPTSTSRQRSAANSGGGGSATSRRGGSATSRRGGSATSRRGGIATSRRRRIAALLSLAGLLTFSVAGAQSDGDWFETALEKTLRLSSPWELPLMPEFNAGNVPDSSSLAPDNPSDTKIVLEVPWGRQLEAEIPSEHSSPKTLVVRLVDDFEDPWLESREDRAASNRTLPDRAPESEAQKNPARSPLKDPKEPEARSTPSKEESFELTDPWAD
jgi:hypothetical protein